MDLQDHRLFRVMIGGLCALTGVSAVVLLGASLVATPRVWFLAGFELLVACAAVVGLLLAAGRFRDGPALALACVVGVIGACSLLAYVGPGKTFLGDAAKIYLAARGLDAALLGLGACLLVWVRQPGVSFRSLLIAAAWVAALIVVAVIAMKVRGALSASSGAIRFACAVVFGGLMIAALSGAVHYVVRAFQAGVGLPRRA
ncbi:MAG: hypothetical protein KF699_08570 [Phycisphaeraceae bacterium]|nr:hypothetical protein [Phycisphaeraceae bacterium]MBX3406143.1 hypothetical protein [Phycisphaeraceae bacterium]